MRIGTDNDLYPAVARRFRVGVGQIHAIDLAINLQRNAGSRGSIDQRDHIELVRLASEQYAPCRVADDVDEWVRDRPEQSLCHLRGVLRSEERRVGRV